MQMSQTEAPMHYDPRSPEALTLLTLALYGGAYPDRATRRVIGTVMFEAGNPLGDEKAKEIVDALVTAGLVHQTGLSMDAEISLTGLGARSAVVLLFQIMQTVANIPVTGAMPRYGR